MIPESVVNEPISLRDVALRQIETVKEVYLISPQRMFSEYRGEKENVKNYNGRQLLEMLQNADDASMAASIGNRKVLIRLEGTSLVIANTGYPFSEEGLESIFLSHLSPKEVMEKQIGKKGLGFRSILSWATEVTIKSHDLCVAFSEEYSKKVLEDLLKNVDFRKVYDRLNKGYQLPIATLVCPNIENANISPFPGMEEYDTVIQITLKENVTPEVLEQISHDLDSEVLLFLNNIEKISFDINGILSKYEKLISSKTEKCIIRYTTGSAVTEKEWNIYTLSGNFERWDKPYELSIAWQDNLEGNKDVIYSYFRTKVAIQSKGIIHGSFELNADRNLIIKDDVGYNEALVNLIPELLTGAAAVIAGKGSKVSYDPIRILQVNLKSIGHLADPDGLKEVIVRTAKCGQLFPVTSGSYLSWNDDDAPVYYEEGVFAKYLDPKMFPEILLHTTDPEVTTFIGTLNGSTYDIQSVIDNLSLLKGIVPVSEYTHIITSVHNEIIESLEGLSCGLFYDNQFNLLSFEHPIFFPSDANSYLPSAIGVQIMDGDLAQELLTATQSKTYAEIAVKLPRFKLREFNFKEVVELLIKYYEERDKLDDIIELHHHLFTLYQNENSSEYKWTEKDVYLLDKKGKRTLAKRLYFGKEYGNFLVDEIYNYDKGKLLCNPKKLKIPENKYDRWRRYCEWLGVVSYPRLITVKADISYADYVMRNFDYKNSIGGYNFRNGYADFLKELTQGYGSITAKSMDDLLGILKNNTTEKILQLLSEYTDIQNYIDKDIEPNNESSIHFWFYNAKVSRAISGGLMRSYIKWVLKSNSWVQTESDILTSPEKCCTAAYITDDFRGLVERPRINYDVLRSKSVNRDKADFILSLAGVHKGINTFSTSMLYSILLRLPEIDPTGKKTKSIYNQLAANYDDKALERIDKADSNYLRFKNEGKVWCHSGSFESIRNVYYVNDKHYGDTIQKQFYTITIDRRRGKEKIRSLFGVSPLEGIELTMIGQIIKHELNTLFEMEMQAFKPYVYVLRRDVDSGSEKVFIKETKFQLVKELKVRMKKDDKSTSLDLNNYEYFYQKERNIAYIKVNKEYADLPSLRDDVFFCSTVAEVFSVILDVDAQRQQIRELFSKSMASRDELLEAEFDDENLQKLQEARRILGVTSDPKIEFWKAFCKCLKGRKFYVEQYTDEQMLDFLLLRHPQLEASLQSVYNELNYENLNEETSLRLIVKLFKEAGITLQQFNDLYYPSIDIKELYEIEFMRSRDEHKNSFKYLLYNKCRLREIGKDLFLQKLQQYDLLQPNIINEVSFDPTEDLRKQVTKIFLIDLRLESKQHDFSSIYSVNEDQFFNSAKQYISDRGLFEQFIEEHIKVQSLLYFGGSEKELIQMLVIWLGRKSAPADGGTLSKRSRITFGNNTILYNNYKDLLDEVDAILTPGVIHGFDVQTIQTSKRNSPKNAGNTGYATGIIGGGKRAIASEVGFLGEYLIYRHLQSKAEPDSVLWVSQYARDSGVNLDGRDGLGYDIQYTPKGLRTTKYVEVKVVGWDDSFNMTSTEVKYGERYCKHYELYLVRNLESIENIKIEIIKNLFDYKGQASFTDNNLFTVINDNFIIKFIKKV